MENENALNKYGEQIMIGRSALEESQERDRLTQRARRNNAEWVRQQREARWER